MLKKIIYSSAGLTLFLVVLTACKTPSSVFEKPALKSMPAAYHSSKDTSDSGKIKWKDFFHDPNLVALIDSALKRNQELNITLQEIEIARNEIRARKGEYLPFVRINGGADVEKTGLYTRYGANDATTDIKPGTATPDPLQNYMLGAYASWELDVWNKLHNAKNAAANRYLASIEGKNFLVTNLISEIAESYYELLMLDNQLEIVKKNIAIQSNALEMVRLQKQAARVTELAVKKFEAEVFNTRSLQFGIQQKIIEAENRINFLTGRYPQPVARNSQGFDQLIPDSVRAGIPSQLLENRPDIRQAERQLIAARLDVRSAKANFYPAFRITAGMGYEAFNPAFFLKTPESMLYSLAGDLVSPLINRNAIKTLYYSANARQVQAVINFERTVLNGFVEVTNQLSNISNLEKTYNLKSQQVQALTQSINISINLFKSAKADYMEVLLTQRDALEAKIELIETKKKQMNAMVNIYRALGGGWF